MSINQSDALEQIQQIMSAERWSPDTLEAIAEVMRAAGYNIDDVPDDHEHEFEEDDCSILVCKHCGIEGPLP